MNRFFVYTDRNRPGLHVWRAGTNVKLYLHPVAGAVGPGWVEFQCELNPAITQPVRFMLFSFNEKGGPTEFENDVFQRELSRLDSGDFPPSVWCVSGASRVVLQDPKLNQQQTLRIHLISQMRFRPGEMYLWDPVTGTNRRIPQTGYDTLGPYFDLNLEPHERSFFNFKFIRQEEDSFKAFEPDTANRWWVADDGDELWTHSGTPAIALAVPQTRTLTLHYRQAFDSPAKLRLWAENGDYVTDVDGDASTDGWTSFATEVYTRLPYSCLFHNPAGPRSGNMKRQSVRA